MTRRFGKAFLTTSAVLVLFINLVMILLYGRQFYACPSLGVDAGAALYRCGGIEPAATNHLAIGLLNLIVIGLLVAIWFSVRFYIKRHHSTNA